MITSSTARSLPFFSSLSLPVPVLSVSHSYSSWKGQEISEIRAGFEKALIHTPCSESFLTSQRGSVYNWPVSWQIVIKTTQVSILAHPKIVFLLLFLQMYHLLSIHANFFTHEKLEINYEIIKSSTNDFSSSSLSSQKTMWIYKCRIVRAKQKIEKNTYQTNLSCSQRHQFYHYYLVIFLIIHYDDK